MSMTERTGYVQIPNTAKSVPLGEKPKRGRHATLGLALEKEAAPAKKRKV